MDYFPVDLKFQNGIGSALAIKISWAKVGLGYLCLLHCVSVASDEFQLSLGYPRVVLRPVVHQQEPRTPPQNPQGPEDVEDRGPTPKEPRGAQPATHWKADDGAKLHTCGDGEAGINKWILWLRSYVNFTDESTYRNQKPKYKKYYKYTHSGNASPFRNYNTTTLYRDSTVTSHLHKSEVQTWLFLQGDTKSPSGNSVLASWPPESANAFIIYLAFYALLMMILSSCF